MTASPLAALDPSHLWNAKAQPLEVVRITRETADVATFQFRAGDGVWFRYRPGQFVTLELPLAAGKLLRTYTLSSTPSRPHSIAVTVKAQRDSQGGRWMLDHLQVGDRLNAVGPAGVFSNQITPAARPLFISAGSGITPMMSMLRYMDDLGDASEIGFLHCARTPADILFRSELENAAARNPRLALGFIVETVAPGQVWSGFRGRISAAAITAIAPDIMDRDVFCCGPAPFMAAVRTILAGLGCDAARYHEESFDGADLPDVQPAQAGATVTGSLRFAQSGKAVETSDASATVLQLARSVGLNIPTGCTMGLCGTCMVLKLEGSVEMNHQGGIMDEDIAAGYILACCSRPRGAVVVDI